MLGIGLGIMALLCAVGLIGGGLFMHHEWKDKKDQPAIERRHNHSQAAERSQGSILEDQKNDSSKPKEEELR